MKCTFNLISIIIQYSKMTEQIEYPLLNERVRARVTAYRRKANEILQRFPVLKNLKLINLCQRFPG